MKPILSERLFLAGVCIVLLIVVAFPYVLAFFSVGENDRFGGFLLNPLDGNTYLAKMYLGWRGDWLFTLPYTPEPGKGAFIYPFYILLGHLARSGGLSLSFTFHLARVLATILLLLTLDRFFSAYLTGVHTARLGLLLASFGSGLGWLALPFGRFTADFWVAETYPFLSAYANPHFPLSLALLLFLFLPYKSARDSSLREIILSRWGVWAFLASFSLAFLSPFGIVIALVVWIGVGAWDLFQATKRPGWNTMQEIVGHVVWIAIGGVPVVLYQWFVISRDPVLSGWNAQNLTPAPHVWDTLVALSPLILLAPFAVRLVIRGEKDQRLILVWLLAGLTLLYVPWGLQRRFMMGLYVPLSAVAAMLLTATSSDPRRFWLRGMVLMLLVLPTNLLVLQAARYGIQTRDGKLFLTRNEADAFEWIEANTPAHALILAAPDTGLLIPAHTGRRVLYGHPFETVGAEEQKDRVERFFRGAPTPDGSAFFSTIDYVFYGPRERQLGKNGSLDGLRVVYQNSGVVLYATR